MSQLRPRFASTLATLSLSAAVALASAMLSHSNLSTLIPRIIQLAMASK